jgi:hypothetical protein
MALHSFPAVQPCCHIVIVASLWCVPLVAQPGPTHQHEDAQNKNPPDRHHQQDAQKNSENSTTIVSESEEDEAQEDGRSVREAAMHTATPEEALAQLAGVELSRTGGPLAPVRLQIRGASGARVTTQLDGMRLSHPGTGAFDLGALPFIALAGARMQTGASSEGLAGTLSLSSMPVLVSGASARLGAGSMRTTRGELWIGHALDSGHTMSAAGYWGQTQGNFLYEPSAAPGRIEVRHNNEQRRYGIFSNGQGKIWGGLDAEIAGLFFAHAGGVPGFSASPTANLRGENHFGGASGRVGKTFSVGHGLLSFQHTAQATTGQRRTFTLAAGPESAVTAHTLHQQLDTTFEGMIPDVSMRFSAIMEHTFLDEEKVWRNMYGGGFDVEARPFTKYFRLHAHVGAQHFSDAKWIPNLNLLAGYESRLFSIGTRVGHAGRAPTLEEMYAPNGLVLGNPDLNPERSTDAEIYSLLRLSRIATIRATIFAGYLHDTILFLNRNAFEIAPANSGPAYRAGAEGRIAIRPHRNLGIEVTGHGIYSALQDTFAPLPVTPPIAMRSHLRFGPSQHLHALWVFRHRSGTTSNLYGTLAVDPYSLLDLVVVLPVAFGTSLSASCTNVFDHRSAQDLNLMPLPSRQFFAMLQVEQ